MKQPKLKPCPFCTSEDVCLETFNGKTEARVRCAGCGTMSGFFNDVTSAANTWNYRPPDAVKERLVDALESTQQSLGLLLDPLVGSPRLLLPEGSIARGVVEGAFYGVAKKIEDSLAAYREDQAS